MLCAPPLGKTNLGLNDSQQVVQELFLSYLDVEPQTTVLHTGLKNLPVDITHWNVGA